VRRTGRRFAATAAAVLAFAGFLTLGVWQLQRLAWKEALIATVDARVSAAPAAPPGPRDWPRLAPDAYAYRHVRVSGVFDNSRETLVQAVTEAGPGFWVLTPLRADRGYQVLVNRGFVPAELAAPAARRAGEISGPTTVTGLLRPSEPHGGFLRANRPAAGRWYSRDVAEIARARGVAGAAPYFIDADATPNVGGWPRGGLTVIRFRNSHLAYALTWFALAGMTALWGAWPLVERLRAHRRRSGTAIVPAHDRLG
jgi:surfeit locus 1 family protein